MCSLSESNLEMGPLTRSSYGMSGAMLSSLTTGTSMTVSTKLSPGRTTGTTTNASPM